jgi:hypothetical protein
MHNVFEPIDASMFPSHVRMDLQHRLWLDFQAWLDLVGNVILVARRPEEVFAVPRIRTTSLHQYQYIIFHHLRQAF